MVVQSTGRRRVPDPDDAMLTRSALPLSFALVLLAQACSNARPAPTSAVVGGRGPGVGQELAVGRDGGGVATAPLEAGRATPPYARSRPPADAASEHVPPQTATEPLGGRASVAKHTVGPPPSSGAPAMPFDPPPCVCKDACFCSGIVKNEAPGCRQKCKCRPCPHDIP